MLRDVKHWLFNMHKQNNQFSAIHFNFVAFMFILLLKIVDFEKYSLKWNSGLYCLLEILIIKIAASEN